jgi:NAD(P)-dependent dehydrogenase (short-subunit alcohol dehydrogenase family)
MDMGSLDGKTVLVLGGSSGIGLATAREAAAAGARVTIASRSAAKLDTAARELGPGIGSGALDAGDDASVASFFGDGPAWDHVVASVGLGGRGRIQDLAMPDAHAAMNGKFWAYYRIARAARIAPTGSLTFVTGGLGHKPAPGAALASAINAAIEGLTRGLAIDFAPVRVNAVCPGMIRTPLWDRMTPSDREAMYARAAATLPARRVGEAEDVAQAILFLIANPYATGSVLVIDGGALIL